MSHPATARPVPAAPTPGRHVHSTWNATLRTALGATLAVTVILLAFLWPTRTSTVKDLPVDVVGSGPALTQARAGLERTGAFAVTSATDRAAAVERIERRESYGAVVVAGSAVEVLTASAASPVASQLLTAVAGRMSAAAGAEVATAKGAAAGRAAQLGAKAAAAEASAQTLAGVAAQSPAAQQAAMGPRVAAARRQALAAAGAAEEAKAQVDAIAPPTITTTDIVPLATEDPRGAGLAVAALPLAMGGMIGGVMISMLVVGAKRRLAAVAGYGVLGGLALAVVLNTWLGVLPGSFAGLWAVIGSALLATAALIVGLNALVGKLGIPLGAVLTMFVGNPLSAASAPAEFLPWHWGAVGQGLVPGAAATLMRQVAYFPHASGLHAWLVIVGWALVGLLCIVAGRFRDQEVVHIEGATETD